MPFQMVEKLLPSRYSLTGPDPEATRNAHDHGHQVLDHEHFELGLGPDVFLAVSERAGYRVQGLWSRSRAHLHVPGEHPLVEVGLLVEEASYDQHSWNGVQHREDAYPDHQLLQLVGLGAVVLHDGPDAEERHEAGQQEDGAEHEVHTERREDETSEDFGVPETDVANTGKDVP